MPFFVERPRDQFGNRAYTPAVVKAEIVESPTIGPTLVITEPVGFKWPVVCYYQDYWAECDGPARFLEDWGENDRVILESGK